LGVEESELEIDDRGCRGGHLDLYRVGSEIVLRCG
jgi:hypothetical protein